MGEPIVVGWREWLGLPELGIERIKAKVDTGARTSSLHVFCIEHYTEKGAPWVRFGVHPVQNETVTEVFCRAAIADKRWVSDSGGHREHRIVVATVLSTGAHAWPVELTLTNREKMRFRMLLGRAAMKHHLCVDPAASYRLKRMKPEPHQVQTELQHQTRSKPS